MTKKEYDSLRYIARLAAGKCKDCDEDVEPGKTGCKEHLKYGRVNFATRKAAGICADCNKSAAQGSTRCMDHIALRNARYAQRKLSGVCTRCDEPSLSGSGTCEKHYLETAARRHLGTKERWIELRGLWEQQDGNCYYTGLVLTMGQNTSIDHIHPRSKGGADEIDNLCWTSMIFNNLKSKYTVDELVAWFRQDVQGRFLERHGNALAPSPKTP